MAQETLNYQVIKDAFILLKYFTNEESIDQVLSEGIHLSLPLIRIYNDTKSFDASSQDTFIKEHFCFENNMDNNLENYLNSLSFEYEGSNNGITANFKFDQDNTYESNYFFLLSSFNPLLPFDDFIKKKNIRPQFQVYQNESDLILELSDDDILLITNARFKIESVKNQVYIDDSLCIDTIIELSSESYNEFFNKFNLKEETISWTCYRRNVNIKKSDIEKVRVLYKEILSDSYIDMSLVSLNHNKHINL